MAHVSIKATSYCLNHTPELGFLYGTTPYLEHKEGQSGSFIFEIPKLDQSYDDVCRYAPNLAYIGALPVEDLDAKQSPMYENLEASACRYGKYGEIMPEDEFLGLMNICDVFDLLWLETSFVAGVKPKLEAHELLGEAQLARLSEGKKLTDIQAEVAKGALPLQYQGNIVGCVRKGHDVDENLSAHVLVENLACKAGGVLSLLHLIKNAHMAPSDIDFVVECSEEAAGDINQRGGGNFAKAVAEICECNNASGCDVRGFCAGPVNAILCAAGMVASGMRPNVAVIAGGAVPKLYMNAREHVKKNMPALENCMGNFGLLLVPESDTLPIIRLDAIGKHSVGVGASPQAVTTALVLTPLEKIGLNLNDVDKYAAELQIPEITVPAGAGNVPEANYKMIAALGVMKQQVKREDMNTFVQQKGMQGFAHTQGHIPSGVPFIGHAVDAIMAKKIQRAMIIGKGSLFLARLTNLADGASFLIEMGKKPESAQAISKDDVKNMLLESLSEWAQDLSK